MIVSNETVMVVLTIAPGLEDAMIDWLVARPESPAFTSIPVHGHGARIDPADISEQVTGRQRRLQFQVVMQEDEVGEFLQSAGREFGQAQVRYWLIPLAASGVLGPD